MSDPDTKPAAEPTPAIEPTPIDETTPIDEPEAPVATADEPVAPAAPAEEPVVAAPATPPRPKGYAVIETGGKQYRVSVGDRISVERLTAEAGGELTIERVLLLGGDGATRVGTPVVDGATVTAHVDDHFRGEKIDVFKYKAKKHYRRKIGHRQEHSHLTITGING